MLFYLHYRILLSVCSKCVHRTLTNGVLIVILQGGCAHTNWEMLGSTGESSCCMVKFPFIMLNLGCDSPKDTQNTHFPAPFISGSSSGFRTLCNIVGDALLKLCCSSGSANFRETLILSHTFSLSHSLNFTVHMNPA